MVEVHRENYDSIFAYDQKCRSKKGAPACALRRMQCLPPSLTPPHMGDLNARSVPPFLAPAEEEKQFTRARGEDALWMPQGEKKRGENMGCLAE